METVFLRLLNMSITASWLVLAVVVFRLVFKKAPKALRVIMWGLVAIRLVCPFSIESILSLIPSAQTVPQDILYSETPSVHTGITALNSTINPVISQTLAPTAGDSVNPIQVIVFIATGIWILGMTGMIVYTFISYWKIHNKVREAVIYKENIYRCDNIDTPFILGIIKPHIYLPSSMSKQDMEYVIAHEKAHLKRHDHWWKPIGFALLTVYWFHPMLWVAYMLLCRDIELACDEKVIIDLGIEAKKFYSEALINCSVSRKSLAACPLAFGEVGVKERVKTVLSYKKPAFWVILVAIVSCVVVAVCFLTNPKNENVESMQMKIAYTMPSCLAFEEDCFYAFDEEDHQYRIFWDDFTGLEENGMVFVEYTEKNRVEYPDGYTTGRNPEYEITAISVKALDVNEADHSNALAEGIYVASGNYSLPYFYLDTTQKEVQIGQSIAMSYARFGTYAFDGEILTLYIEGSEKNDIYVLHLNESGSFEYDENASVPASEIQWFEDGMVFELESQE